MSSVVILLQNSHGFSYFLISDLEGLLHLNRKIMIGKKRKLLIVDDSALIVKRLLSTLQENLSNTEIISAATGADALTALHSIKPEVVLLDIQLPDINGIEILKTIRSSYPETSVIMLSNQSANHTRNTCINAGAEAFYDKSKEFELAMDYIKSLEQ